MPHEGTGEEVTFDQRLGYAADLAKHISGLAIALGFGVPTIIEVLDRDVATEAVAGGVVCLLASALFALTNLDRVVKASLPGQPRSRWIDRLQRRLPGRLGLSKPATTSGSMDPNGPSALNRQLFFPAALLLVGVGILALAIVFSANPKPRQCTEMETQRAGSDTVRVVTTCVRSVEGLGG